MCVIYVLILFCFRFEIFLGVFNKKILFLWKKEILFYFVIMRNWLLEIILIVLRKNYKFGGKKWFLGDEKFDCGKFF